jgi:hypothetical protein
MPLDETLDPTVVACHLARATSPVAPDILDITDPMGRDVEMFRLIGQQVAAVLLPVLDARRTELVPDG